MRSIKIQDLIELPIQNVLTIATSGTSTSFLLAKTGHSMSLILFPLDDWVNNNITLERRMTMHDFDLLNYSNSTKNPVVLFLIMAKAGRHTLPIFQVTIYCFMSGSCFVHLIQVHFIPCIVRNNDTCITMITFLSNNFLLASKHLF